MKKNKKEKSEGYQLPLTHSAKRARDYAEAVSECKVPENMRGELVGQSDPGFFFRRTD